MVTDTHQCITCPALGRDGNDDRPAPNRYTLRWCCEDCPAQLQGLLVQIPDLYSQLDPAPGGNRPERVSGSANAPLGVRAAVLDHLYRGPALTLPALPYGPDQDGDLPAVRTLYQIALAWIQARPAHLHETLPDPDVQALAHWLRDRTTWACSSDNLTDHLPYHAWALATLAHHLRLLVQGAPERPEPLPGIECRQPGCGCYTLVRTRGDVLCTACGDRMTPAEYDRWTGLLAAHATGKEG